MKYPFNESEELIYDFEKVLNDNGVMIQNESDLQRISLAVLETNAKHKKEIRHEDTSDIRLLFADVAGIVDFARKIVKHKDHKDFQKLVPHLHLLNTSGTAVMTSKSKVTDEGNNKLMELYVALLCMSFATDVDFDDPNNSKCDNSDIMFTFKDIRWAIVCKALHSDNVKTLFDTIEKGTEQINRSSAAKGIVIVNFKNIIDRDTIWPIFEVENGEPVFDCYSSISTPLILLKQYGSTYRKSLEEIIGTENLIKLKSDKCPAAFVTFLHAISCMEIKDQCVPMILKTLNIVFFDPGSVENQAYVDMVQKLNDAMHDII